MYSIFGNICQLIFVPLIYNNALLSLYIAPGALFIRFGSRSRLLFIFP
jgi:hypothetical protein